MGHHPKVKVREEMSDSRALFLIGTGAGSCVRLPELIGELLTLDITLYSVLTPNTAAVRNPEELMLIPGNNWIRDYGEDPLDRYPFGMLLVAPCTFNTFNKLAHGIADTLATSMVADGIGAGCPVVIAPSMNHGLWAHPQTKVSRERLESWGCEIVDPMITERQVTMAPTDVVVEAVRRKLNGG
jgi:phosphopantothenoylcysteine synthetase/decarboxylase